MFNFILYFLLILPIFSDSISTSKKYHNRYYIKDALISTFGKNEEVFINKWIFKRGDIFSGSCDLYQSDRSNHNDLCSMGISDIRRPIKGTVDNRREIVMNNVCSRLSNNKSTLNFYLKGIDTKIFSINNVKKAYHKLISSTFDDEVYRILNRSNSTVEIKWRVLVKSICRSDKWQIF